MRATDVIAVVNQVNQASWGVVERTVLGEQGAYVEAQIGCYFFWLSATYKTRHVVDSRN